MPPDTATDVTTHPTARPSADHARHAGRGASTPTALLVLALAIATLTIAWGVTTTHGQDPSTPPGMGAPTASPSMGGMDGPSVPPVHGFYAGTEILYLHTEASDQGVAEMLTAMMGSPVLVVPSLARVSAGALATVYVFTNGSQPDGARGPFGFRPDVFDSAPGDVAYSPLRAVAIVTWADPARATVLRSADEVEAAIADGRLGVERPGVVVNMPFLTWPGGSR